MSSSLFRRLVVVVLVFAAAGGLPAPLQSQTMVLRADHMVDVASGRLVSPAVVVIPMVEMPVGDPAIAVAVKVTGGRPDTVAVS